jgi:phage-related tail fiber protein
LECDGAAVSRTTYALLFAVVGTTFGAGNGTTTFNVPDLRGEFVRGWDDGRGVDTGRAFGSTQADALKAHLHSVTPPASDGTGGSGLTGTGSGGSETITPYNTAETGGAETRPRNVAMLYIIRTGL